MNEFRWVLTDAKHMVYLSSISFGVSAVEMIHYLETNDIHPNRFRGRDGPFHSLVWREGDMEFRTADGYFVRTPIECRLRAMRILEKVYSIGDSGEGGHEFILGNSFDAAVMVEMIEKSDRAYLTDDDCSKIIAKGLSPEDILKYEMSL